MAGSYTNYHGFALISDSEIHRGQEIFVDGTLEQFQQAELPLEDEYKRSRAIVASLVVYHKQFPELSEEHWIDILYRLRTEMMQDPGVARLLPKMLDELLRMDSTSVEAATMIARDFDWVKQNGKQARSIVLMFFFITMANCARRVLFGQHSRRTKHY